MPNSVRLFWKLCLVSVVMWSNSSAQNLEFSGYSSFESRNFPESPLLKDQFSHSNVSLAFQPELYYAMSNGNHRFLFVPFLRIDQHNGNRTHFDIREMYWQYYSGIWEMSVGFRKVFWGVTESHHLLDIINQTDLVENLDNEDKLGQPMINLNLIHDYGTFGFYLMPYFRKLSFLNKDARLRFPMLIDTNSTEYESNRKEWHFDWAVRWSHTLGIFDIGLSHFSGTTREPLLFPKTDETRGFFLTPFYHTIQQTGLDVQTTTGGLLLKLEAISRSGQEDQFFAFVSGFEYTLGNIYNSGTDIGILAEYLYDERNGNALTPFEDDIFVGMRLVLNDVQSSELLAGVIVDRNLGSSLLNIEAGRRIGDRWKLNWEIRGFINVSDADLYYGFRKDHYLQIELTRFF